MLPSLLLRGLPPRAAVFLRGVPPRAAVFLRGVPPRAPRLKAPSTRTRAKSCAIIAALDEISGLAGRARAESRLGPGEPLEQSFNARHALAQFTYLAAHLAHVSPQATDLRPHLAQTSLQLGPQLRQTSPRLGPQAVHFSRKPPIEVHDFASQVSNLAPQRPHAGHHDGSQGDGGNDDWRRVPGSALPSAFPKAAMQM